MEDKIQKIERQLKMQRIYTLLVTVMLGGFLFSSFRNSNNFDVVRTRGIIIVDSLGRERILIGAPIPYAKNRIRTNLKRVQEAWGKNMNPKYMEWYKKYNNSTNGMLILDEKGYDRIAVGDAVPDPNIGQRIGPETGIIINSKDGFERSGYGVLDVEEQERVVLGLDRKGGREGVTLSIMEDGSAGLSISDKKSYLFMGNTPKDGLPFELPKDLFGFASADSGKVKYNFNVIK